MIPPIFRIIDKLSQWELEKALEEFRLTNAHAFAVWMEKMMK